MDKKQGMIGYHYRTKKYGSLIFPFFLMCLIGGAVICTAGEKKDETKNAIEMFLQEVNAGHITKVDCYYVEWGDPMASISEKELIESKHDFSVTAKFESVYSLLKIQEAFEKPQLEKINTKHSYDCRMSYGFYNKEKEILRLTFAANMPVVLINGEAFKPSDKLLRILLPILPHQAYETFHSHMRELWSNRKVE